ncbi:alpha/beta hydrolase [Actinoallomurus acanthiterrae]
MPEVERPTQTIEVSGATVEYRLERRGPRIVLMLHGGHMRAGLPLGEQVFADTGYTILAPSRPGYGRTSLAAGPTPARFCDLVTALCRELGIETVTAVVGQSAGGPTAVTMAARHPDLVQRLILQSAVGFLPWPPRRIRTGAALLFAPRAEKMTWALTHSLMRRAPRLGLRLLLRDLTMRPVGPFLTALGDEHRSLLVELFGRMRSGSGFAADLRAMADPSAQEHLPATVRQPTLVIATPNDGAVRFAHARSLAAAIPHGHLVTSRADSHFIWFSDDYPTIAAMITDFLTEQSGTSAASGS